MMHLVAAVTQGGSTDLTSNIGNAGVGALLLALVGTAGVFVWRVIVASRQQDDAMSDIVKAQVESLVKPLQEEVKRLREGEQACRLRVSILSTVLNRHGIAVPPEVYEDGNPPTSL